MLNLKNLLCAALAATLFFSASNAEARFGKSSHSSDSDSDEKKEKKKEHRDEPSSSHVHDASPATPSRVHDATPVGTSRPPPPPPPPEPPRERVIVVEPAPTYYVEPAPPPTYYVEPAPPPPPTYIEPAPVAPPPELAVRKDTLFSPLRMGFEGGPSGGGTRGNLFLALEGERLGLDGRISGLSLPTDDGTGGTDEIALSEVHLTYAVIAQERLRLRLEGGFSYAGAPDLKVYGLSLGGSLEGRLGGNLDLELRLQATPFPYRQIDSSAALALKLYPFALRAGWRTLLMDDAGLVDGESHQDIFNGPFVGVGLNF